MGVSWEWGALKASPTAMGVSGGSDQGGQPSVPFGGGEGILGGHHHSPPDEGCSPSAVGYNGGMPAPTPGCVGQGCPSPWGRGGGHGADAGCPQGPAPRPVPHVSPCSPPPSPLPHPAPALPWGPAGPPPAPRGPPCPTVLFLPPLGCWGSLQPPNLHPGPGLWQAAVAGRLGGDLAGITKPSDKTLGRERRD